MQTKHPLPHTVTKKQLVAMYLVSGVPYKMIIEEAQEVMIKNRANKTIEQVKNAKCLLRSEFLQLIKLFGMPKNFADDEIENKIKNSTL